MSHTIKIDQTNANMKKMGQEGEEGVLDFLPWLNSQASLCDLEVTCECIKRVSYAEQFKTLQLIHELYDKDIQENMLATELHWRRGRICP